jgi:hypothetical protein
MSNTNLNCLPILGDNRDFTDYRPNYIINNELKNTMCKNKNSYDYKNCLIQNTDKIFNKLNNNFYKKICINK